jgi:hypothetical protein
MTDKPKPDATIRKKPKEKPQPAKTRTTVRAVNEALAARGHKAMLFKGGGDYFFFRGEDVNSWLDRTVRVARIGDLSVREWVRALQDLRKKNEAIRREGARGRRR